jgi:flagellar biosynthesis protein FlhF
MHIRTFRARSLQEAMAEIRRQMGPDAAVLHTRPVRQGALGFLRSPQIEVTAGLRTTQRDELTKAVDARLAALGTVPVRRDPPTSDGGIATEEGATKSEVQQQLHRLTTMVEQMQRQQLVKQPWQPYPVLRQWMEQWVGDGALASDVGPWLEWLVARASPEELQQPEAVMRRLAVYLQGRVRVSGPIPVDANSRQVVALVGPTGVGKTTTIAKLAAGLKLHQKKRVGLVTIDTFRIAAIEQLRAYADIMDLPMAVVEQPEQMRLALDRMAAMDVVLIDTTGRSPRDEPMVEQLGELLALAQPDQTHLVLSATSSPSALRDVVRGFAPLAPTQMVMTKVDEVPSMVAVMPWLMECPLPLSYLTDGQHVPDDIVAASRPLLAELALSRNPWLQITERVAGQVAG